MKDTAAVDSTLWQLAAITSTVRTVAGYEGMHNDDLGVFIDMVDGIVAYIKLVCNDAKTSNKVLDILNRRLAALPRADDFQLPSYGAKYFGDRSNIQAKEHRNVQQVLPLVLAGLPSVSAADVNRLIKLAISYNLQYMARTRRNESQWFTEEDVDAIRPLICDFHDQFVWLMLKNDPGYTGTIKQHRLFTHSLSAMVELGHPKHCNAQFGEAGHQISKRAYKKSSKRKRNNQFYVEVVRTERRRIWLNSLPDLPDRNRRQYKSAFTECSRSGAPQLAGRPLGLPLEVLTGAAVAEGRVGTLLAAQPEVRQAGQLLPGLLPGFLRATGRQPAAYQPQLSRGSIYAVKTAVIAARVPWDPHQNRCQTLHASYNHCGLVWYDTVQVQLENDTQYAQLRLIFSCSCEGVDLKLALVRWLEPTTPNDVLAAAGAKVLRYEMHGRGRARQVLHGVVALQSIVRRVYAVPTWATAFDGTALTLDQHRFRLCPWKWDREVPDLDGFVAPPQAMPVLAADQQLRDADAAGGSGVRGQQAEQGWGGGAGDAGAAEGEEPFADDGDGSGSEGGSDVGDEEESGSETDSDLESNYDD